MQRIDRLRTLTKQEIQKVRFVFAPTHPVLAALDYRSNDCLLYTSPSASIFPEPLALRGAYAAAGQGGRYRLF